MLVCLYALRGFTRPSYISGGGGEEGGVGGEGGSGRCGGGENGVNAAYTRLKPPKLGRHRA